MTEANVHYEQQDSTVVVTLNRPDKRNALSRSLIHNLHAAFDKAADDSGVRCVIVTGAGSCFCAGMDLAELQESLGPIDDDSPVWDDALHLAQLYDKIYTLPKPTIAAINGAAVAGGAGLMSVCDLAVAVPNAKIGYPEVRRGLVAAMVMPHLLRHVGERMARYLLLTGELVDGQRAKECGLVNDVAEPDSLMGTVHEWANALRAGGPEALDKTKGLLREFSPMAQSVDHAAKASAAPRLSEECRQGLEAFFAKRPAPWSS